MVPPLWGLFDSWSIHWTPQRRSRAHAIRYSPGGGEIELAVERSDNIIRFSVRDPGIGIDTRHHPHIGEKFYRADPSSKPAPPASGSGSTSATNSPH